MTYNEWLETIELVEKSNRNHIYLQKMISAPNNENINELLKPKLVDLITNKLKKAIKRIIHNLRDTFHNSNTLEFTISNFEKELEYIYSICNLPEIDQNTRNEIMVAIKEQRDRVYEILINKSLEIDRTGMYKIIIEKKKNGKKVI